jgi:hypothetical protein
MDTLHLGIADNLGRGNPLEHPPPQDSPEAAISVRDMLTIGVSIVQLIQFIERQIDYLVTRYDVEAFSRPTIAQVMLGETDSLLAQLGEHDEAYIYVVVFHGVERRAAIIMITESERLNLDRFSDVI